MDIGLKVIALFSQSLLVAQAPAAQDDPGGLFRLLLPMIFIMVLFYFMLIRPQKKKEQELRETLNNLKENDRVVTIGGIHGIVTKGGEAANIVPAHTTARYMARSERIDGLTDLRQRVVRCFEAGALATGATLDIQGGDKPYAQVEHDPALSAIYERNASALGRVFEIVEGQQGYFTRQAGGRLSARQPGAPRQGGELGSGRTRYLPT